MLDVSQFVDLDAEKREAALKALDGAMAACGMPQFAANMRAEVAAVLAKREEEAAANAFEYAHRDCGKLFLNGALTSTAADGAVITSQLVTVGWIAEYVTGADDIAIRCFADAAGLEKIAAAIKANLNGAKRPNGSPVVTRDASGKLVSPVGEAYHVKFADGMVSAIGTGKYGASTGKAPRTSTGKAPRTSTGKAPAGGKTAVVVTVTGKDGAKTSKAFTVATAALDHLSITKTASSAYVTLMGAVAKREDVSLTFYGDVAQSVKDWCSANPTKGSIAGSMPAGGFAEDGAPIMTAPAPAPAPKSEDGQAPAPNKAEEDAAAAAEAARQAEAAAKLDAAKTAAAQSAADATTAASEAAEHATAAKTAAATVKAPAVVTAVSTAEAAAKLAASEAGEAKTAAKTAAEANTAPAAEAAAKTAAEHATAASEAATTAKTAAATVASMAEAEKAHGPTRSRK